jgi:hypothetical protein
MSGERRLYEVTDHDLPWQPYRRIENISNKEANIKAIDFEARKAQNNLHEASKIAYQSKLRESLAGNILAVDFDINKGQGNLKQASEINAETQRKNVILGVVDMTIEHKRPEADKALKELASKFDLQECNFKTKQSKIELEFDQEINFENSPALAIDGLKELVDVVLVPFEENADFVNKAIEISTEELAPRSMDSIGYVDGKGWVVKKPDEEVWRVVAIEHIPDFIKSGISSNKTDNQVA